MSIGCEAFGQERKAYRVQRLNESLRHVFYLDRPQLQEMSSSSAGKEVRLALAKRNLLAFSSR